MADDADSTQHSEAVSARQAESEDSPASHEDAAGAGTPPAEPEATNPSDGVMSSSDAVAATIPRPVPEGTLSFSGHMWDRFDFLWRQRLMPSERLIEQVALVLRQRAHLERHYAANIGDLAAHVQTDSQSSSLHGAVEAVMVNFRNRGEQSVNLADQIEQDVVITFEEVVAQHKEISKKLQFDMQLLIRYRQETYKKHEKCSQRYGRCCAEAEAAATESLQGIAMKPAERTKLVQRATSLSLQARAAEREYYESINQANKAKIAYEAHLPIVLAAMQDMEDKRALCLRDGLRKLAVYEISWLRNMQYDLEATVKTSEGVDVDEDLQAFLRDCWKDHGQIAPTTTTPQIEVAQAYWQLSRPRPPKDTPERKRLMEDSDLITQRLIPEYQPLLQTVLSDDKYEAKDGEGIQPTPAVIAAARTLRHDLLDQRRRAALCQVLKTEVLRKEPQGTELDNAKQVVVPQAAIDVITPIFTAALDACEEQNDCCAGRDMMVLAQHFKADGEGKSTSLLSRVYSHKLWSKVTFWEDVLLVGLCEAHAAEVLFRKQLAPGSQFLQPSMTAFLSRFVAHMLAYGIRLEQGRSAVSSAIRKNAQLLGTDAKTYETLLLQAYDTAPAQPGARGTDNAEPGRTMEEPKSSSNPDGESQAPSSGNVSASTATTVVADAETVDTTAAAEDDDFEAVAFGLPPSETSSVKAEVSESSTDQTPPVQTSAADVFG